MSQHLKQLFAILYLYLYTGCPKNDEQNINWNAHFIIKDTNKTL